MSVIKCFMGIRHSVLHYKCTLTTDQLCGHPLSQTTYSPPPPPSTGHFLLASSETAPIGSVLWCKAACMVHKMQTGWQETKLLTAELVMLPGENLHSDGIAQLIEPVDNTVEREKLLRWLVWAWVWGLFFFFCALVFVCVRVAGSFKKCPRLIFQAGDADGDSPSSTDEVSPYWGCLCMNDCIHKWLYMQYTLARG